MIGWQQQGGYRHGYAAYAEPHAGMRVRTLCGVTAVVTGADVSGTGWDDRDPFCAECADVYLRLCALARDKAGSTA